MRSWHRVPLIAVIVLTIAGHAFAYDFSAENSRKGVAQASKYGESYFVKRAIDGDTLLLANGERIRLIGVDTPETKHPSKPVQYFGKEASEFTRREVEGREIRLEYDVERVDKYGRTLAYVYRIPDEFFVNAELIKQGYGHAYTRFPFKYMEEFRQYEADARKHARGLWDENEGS